MTEIDCGDRRRVRVAADVDSEALAVVESSIAVEDFEETQVGKRRLRTFGSDLDL